ncbi:hypothetical protein [Acanthopleuribacter pedis]|uniref:Phage tail assembly protein n=1 Tax=Acanthopleuribacter pedis TaxID=442870 RepID=A0A8J7QA01_9BACT|nr:hypothetical protein [Acanthopleuribacter pedis]MBO1319744.1 hypothetical protein [Acanthopleuribacter pedis]
MSDVIKTEFPFELPIGYTDKEGNSHRHGVMRMATAADEILPMKDPRVRNNPAYLSIILLARVITRLGSLDPINTDLVEQLYSQDFAYLQDLHHRINKTGTSAHQATCPKCDHRFEVAVEPTEGR